MKSKIKIFFVVIFVFDFAPCAVFAESIMYWRFENGLELTDSSGNQRSLDSGPGLGDTSPDSGGITDPVAATGAANGQKLKFAGTSATPIYTATLGLGTPIMNMSTFTIEVFFNLKSTSSSQALVSYLTGDGDKFVLYASNNTTSHLPLWQNL